MCLGKPYNEAWKKRIIKKLEAGRGYIIVYKVVYKAIKRFKPIFYADITPYYKQGMQKAYLCEGDESGWHAFLDKKSALKYKKDFPRCQTYQYHIILKCLALPKHVIDCGHAWDGIKTIRLTHLFFPTFPKTVASVREFKKAIKAKKIKT